MKVAIVGGGCAGIAAAWQLANQKGYQVDVYEQSWSLGGKGASGRAPDGRIEEHGLHIWLGFYENAFRMVRDCYEGVESMGWGPHARAGQKLAHGSFEEAFFEEPHIGVAIPDSTEDYATDPGKKWNIWSGFLPPAEGVPGDGPEAGTNPFTLGNYLVRCFQLLKTLMHSVIGPPDEPVPGSPRGDARSDLDEARDLDFAFDATRSPEAIIGIATRYIRAGALTSAAGMLQAVTIIEKWLRKMSYAPQMPDAALEFMEAVAAQARKQLRDLVSIDQKLRWKTEIIDIVLTIAIGLYRDRVLFEEKGLDAINHIDYREWLLQHGATNTSVDSHFITGIYDLTFAYRNGERTTPALAAGVGLRGALRMFFTYRGAMFWRMRSGMGDAVFAPLYKMLQERGVRFHFLHSLDKIHFDVADGRCFVRSLEFDIGGRPRGTLDRLSKNALDHFGCWPNSERRFSTAKRRREVGAGCADFELKADRHFDAVIFTMGIDDLSKVCGRDTAYVPAQWAEAGRHVKTVATQAAQVWLDRDLQQLGWRRGFGIITTLEPPFETWADMTHTLATEREWLQAQKTKGTGRKKRKGRAAAPGAPAPERSVAYFCGVMSDERVRRYGETLRDEILKDVHALLGGKIKAFWPAAFKDGVTAAQRVVREPYVQPNFKGSARYTLSLPGSIEHRISPLDMSVMNATLAGDWTASGLDAGCVESAVISGMLAAYAITNVAPPLSSIIGYDHP